MGNILHKKGRIPTTLEEENEPIPKMLPTWEKVLDSEKEEFEACKCSFAAKGNERCCKSIKDFRISREICCNEKISVYEVIDTGTKERFAVKIYDKREGEKYQNNEIIILTILRDIEGDFVRCEHLFSTMTHNIIVLELFVSNFFKYMKHRKKMLSLEMASFIMILKMILKMEP
ncbi:hypothetical protein MHBO_001312 [Bonamia ostreae]|uniref:Protein kinase domain-containing protein n=1 Tax=Bonamia ostreae TaxID=126728 RepID=A0ABV2AII9_9EUKA